MVPTSTSLILRVRDPSDDDSWREFVELYEPLLMSFVRSRGLPDADARDVVQEILINLVRALPKFELDRQKGRFRTWLWQVTMHAIADAARRRRTRQGAEQEWWQRAGEPIVAEPAPDFVAAHRQRVLNFVLPRVRATTKPKTWQCFEQYILCDRPAAAVAEEVGLPANTVYVHSNRVLEKVRAHCAEYMEELGDA